MSVLDIRQFEPIPSPPIAYEIMSQAICATNTKNAAWQNLEGLNVNNLTTMRPHHSSFPKCRVDCRYLQNVDLRSMSLKCLYFPISPLLLRCNTPLVQNDQHIQFKGAATFLTISGASLNIFFIIKFSCSLNGHISSPNYVDY